MELVLSAITLKRIILKIRNKYCFSFKQMKPEEINQEEDVNENTPLLVE